jgi:hypothetical protein
MIVLLLPPPPPPDVKTSNGLKLFESIDRTPHISVMTPRAMRTIDVFTVVSRASASVVH